MCPNEIVDIHRSGDGAPCLSLNGVIALVAIAPDPPQLFDADPRPLLFSRHGRGVMT